MIVVDASIALKWLLWEAQSEAALDFLQRYRSDLIAPDLILIEVTRALVRIANEHKVEREPVAQLLERWIGDWGQAAVDTVRTAPARLRAGAELALRLGHPLPDCLYLALAIERQAELATADAKFQRKAVEVYPAVRMLADYA